MPPRARVDRLPEPRMIAFSTIFWAFRVGLVGLPEDAPPVDLVELSVRLEILAPATLAPAPISRSPSRSVRVPPVRRFAIPPRPDPLPALPPRLDAAPLRGPVGGAMILLWAAYSLRCSFCRRMRLDDSAGGFEERSRESGGGLGQAMVQEQPTPKRAG